MQYVTTEGAQGICPTNSHIPSDNEWKTLEMQLGMTQSEADVFGAWRGIDQGTKLQLGGSSGLDMPFAGNRKYDGTFNILSLSANLWSSSLDSGSNVWYRYMSSTGALVGRNVLIKTYGISIRCVVN